MKTAADALSRFVRPGKEVFFEPGSESVRARMSSGEQLLTSVITFAEIHAVIARKSREGGFTLDAYRQVCAKFALDWQTMQILEADLRTMAGVPQLVNLFPLRAADAIHLSTALWLREQIATSLSVGAPQESFCFGSADLQLIRIAEQCGLSVFNPEEAE